MHTLHHSTWLLRRWKTPYSRVMAIDVMLELMKVRLVLLKLFCSLWLDFSDTIKHVLSHILMSILLENFSWKLLLFVLNSVDKVAVITSVASHWPVVVLTWNSSVVPNFDLLSINFLLLLQLLCFLVNQILNLTFDLLNILLVLKPNLNEGLFGLLKVVNFSLSS